MLTKLRNFLCLIITLAIVIGIVPTQAVAAFTSEKGTPTKAVEEVTEQAKQDFEKKKLTADDIVGEVESLRSADTKHFKLEDGSYIAVQYDTDVHFKNESGKWQDINNELKPNETGLLALPAESFTVTENDLETSVSANSSDAKDIETKHDKYSVSFDMIDAKETEVKIEEKKSNDDGSLASALELPNISSTVTYAEIQDGVDLQYTMYGNEIKESINVNERLDEYSYAFKLNLENLNPVVKKDGSISLVDAADGSEVYLIPAPYMFDAAGAVSSDVSYTLEENENGEYILTVTADKEWINDDTRQFPVSIDPTLVYNVTGSNTDYTYVSSGTPDTNHNGWSALYLGYDSGTTKKNRILMRVNTLPTLPVNSVVVNAAMYFAQMDYSYVAKSAMNIEAHALTSSIASFRDATWNNQPSFSNEIVDFNTVSDSTDGTYVGWDITRITKNWYSTPSSNYGAVLIATDEGTMSGTNCAKASYYSSVNPPKYVVQYRNTVGLEGYYTYQTQDVGRAGTGYVSDYTTQLTLGKTDATNAGIMKFTLSHFYNSAYAFYNFSSADMRTADYSNMLMGAGWKLSAQQSVVQTTVGSTTYLVYTDADGTEHYFAFNSSDGYYYDEDGLSLKIQKTTYSGMTNYKMTDDKGNIMEFYNGLLSVMTDSNGNKIYFIYNNYNAGSPITGTTWCPTGTRDRLLAIVQVNDGESFVTLATLTYDANGYLQTIRDRANNQTTYTYGYISTIKLLTGVTHADGTTVSYTYDPDIVKMSKATDNETKRSVAYTYDIPTRSMRSIQEYGYSFDTQTSVLGNTLFMFRSDAGFTKYREIGTDRVRDTVDDILTYVLFDNGGHTINEYSTNYNETIILGATANAYTTPSGTSGANNKLSDTTTTGVESVNRLKNGSMELSSDWTPDTSGSAQITTTQPKTGTRSQEVSLSGTGLKFFKQSSVPVTAGQQYTYSVYVNTSEITDMNGGGIYLTVEDGTNTHQSNTFNFITPNYGTQTYVPNEWQRISVTFTPVTNNINLLINYNKFNGKAFADDAQLELGAAPSHFSMVNNGSFDFQNEWLLSSGIANYDTTVKMSATGASVKASSDPSVYPYAFQNIPVNLSSDYTYKLSGWAKGTSVPMTYPDRRFYLHALVFYSDGTPNDDFYAKFNPDSTEWQYASVAIVPKQSGKIVSRIEIYCEYGRNANTAYFDNISLVCSQAQSYKYDSKGNVTAVTATNNETPTYTYNGADLMKAVTKDSGTYDYTYDGAHNVSTVTNNGVTMGLTYDAKGNTSTSTLSGASGQKIGTSATYTDYGNLVAAITDSRGNVTEYTYDSIISKVTGQSSAIKDPINPSTFSSYNPLNGRLDLSYMAGKIAVNNYYTNGKLSSIARGGYLPEGGAKLTQNYMYDYTEFADVKSVSLGTSAGNRTLATYNYKGGNGPLESLIYGNGAKTEYTYDMLERIASIKYNDATGYNYTYTGEGQLYEIKSFSGNYNKTFNYDTIGRILNSNAQSSNTGITENLRYSYDSTNRLKGFGYIVDFAAGATDINEYEFFTYNADGTLKDKRTGYGDVISFTYDDLKRVSRRDFNETPTNNIFSVNYAYIPGSGQNATTPLVWGMRYLDGAVTLRKLGYTYDALGNILTVSNDTSTEVSYVYDAQNQLTSETILNANTKYTYTYDTYGNIREVKSEPISGGTATIKTYTYGDSKWLDLLTAYNGSSITYDNIGNPLSYYDGTTMTWNNGRQLTSLSKSGTTTNYVYNADGIRTKKTVGGVVHNYILDGSRILADYSNGSELRFYYDESNKPQSFTYNGVKYNYITNLQGDVLEIRDSNNALAGSYIYNAYGKIISKSGAMADINPLRYRGYYFDTETGFYYLNSRFYDAEIGRFINADDTDILTASQTADKNLFNYCDNNPVVRKDGGGDFWDTVLDVISLTISVGEVIANPSSASAWISLGADIICTVVPGLTGGGTIVRAVTKANKIIDTVKAVDKVSDTSKAIQKGWKVGDNITALTKAGNAPKWSTVRSRYWKNEAMLRPNNYSTNSLNRMKKGSAPLVEYYNGKLYSMELHHIKPRKLGGSNAYDNLMQLAPWDHAAIDKHRHFRP